MRNYLKTIVVLKRKVTVTKKVECLKNFNTEQKMRYLKTMEGLSNLIATV